MSLFGPVHLRLAARLIRIAQIITRMSSCNTADIFFSKNQLDETNTDDSEMAYPSSQLSLDYVAVHRQVR